MVQVLRFDRPAEPVGVLPCPALQACMLDPRIWPFSSAVRRYPVWPQPLLNVAEVALKLQAFATSIGAFLGCDSAQPRAYLLGSCFAARNFHKGCGFYYL